MAPKVAAVKGLAAKVPKTATVSKGPKATTATAEAVPQGMKAAGGGHAEVADYDEVATAAKGPKATRVTAEAAPKGMKAADGFYAEVADYAGFAPEIVKTVIHAMHTVGARSLRNKRVFKVPGLVMFRLKTTAACAAKTKMVMGKEVICKAKPAGMVIRSSPLKEFRDATGSG